jgi:predicted transcriptional regulator of viral defense system
MTGSTVSQAIDTFRSRGGILHTGEALAAGIHPRTLYQMRDSGVLERLTRGIYRLSSGADLAHPDLVTVALRIPRAVICLVSALSYHDATNEVPHEVHVALPPRTKAPRLDHPPVRVFWFSGDALSMGVETVTLDGVEVRVYDLPKTVVDCFRFRSKLGLDVAVDALRQATQRKGVSPAEILRYARRCHIGTVILPYIEALQ